MSLYLNRSDAREILSRMKGFESDLETVYSRWSYDFRENLGRRNALVSMSQEVETARVLSSRFQGVYSDGAPGKPDIVIEEISAELECKITSGSRSGNSVNYELRTDWETICNKERLDYVYILSDESFENFAFLFFDGLTPDDFFPPSSGSRGKTRMNKAKGMKKCTALFGSFSNRNHSHIDSLNAKIEEVNKKFQLRMSELQSRKTNTHNQEMKKRQLIENEIARTNRKLEHLQERVAYWENASDSYSFNLESLN